MFCESKFPHMCVCVNRMMWAAGAVAAMSSITFPAVSALVSQSADPDKQGESLSLSPRALRHHSFASAQCRSVRFLGWKSSAHSHFL